MPARVVIAGGGVAAIETVAALRAVLGETVDIAVIAPAPEVEQRPLSVTVPFGGTPSPLSLDRLSERLRFELHLAGLEGVEPDLRRVRLDGDRHLAYDKLVIATGAVPRPAFPGAITFASAADGPAVAEALGTAGQVAFVSPLASGWTMPLYELALLAADRLPGPDIAVITAEPRPLWVFGAEAGEAIGDLFRRRGIALLAGVRVLAAENGMLELDGAEPVPAEHAVAMPRLSGPAINGLPHDEEGFIPVDAHGQVSGVADVYAAGDVTAFPLKQGGLATEQADAAAESIAAELGADIRPKPFDPVLRGLLLTGGAPLYLRSDGAAGSADRLPHATVSSEALWWPSAKVAGRHLAPLLAAAGSGPTTMSDLGEPPGARAEEADPAELTLLLAREDALHGEYDSALRALDTAERLAGGHLAPEWQRARTMWRARMEWDDRG